MPWIKRNIYLVVGGVVALALLGVAGFYLYTKIGEDQAVTAQLSEQTEKLKTLVNRNPHPGTDQVDNIAAAKAEHQKLQDFLIEVKKFFPAPSYSTQLNNKDFRVLLDNTVNELQINAEKSGVEIPSDYWFSFSGQQKLMNFNTADLEPLTAQLMEVKTICNVLFDAKITRLEAIKRAPIAKSDTQGGQDYVATKPTTNQWAITMPYEVTFQAFTPELESVLNGLIKTPECVIVKNLAVDQAPVQEASASPSYNTGGSTYMNPELQNRYGLRPGGRYGLPQPVMPAAPQRVVGKDGMTTILSEKPLRITLTIETVKPKLEKKKSL